jgi:hypothetical protein
MNELAPRSAVPLAYYLFAHASLAAGLGVLIVDPSLPGTSFYHPRFVALVHLLTIPWLTGSILGSLYIVGPLALRVPMASGRADWTAFASFVFGTIGMIAHFWLGTYDGMAWSAAFVLGAVLSVGVRVWRGLGSTPAPPAVPAHVRLAFVNVAAAVTLGILMGLDRSRGFLGISPLAAMFAHAHLAAIGWAAMIVVGLSYRLIPMILPAAMPTGRGLIVSALLLEAGLTVLVIALLAESHLAWTGAAVILGGFGSFVWQIRSTVSRRMPRPPALPRRDWSTWQAHAAFLWLMIAAVLGMLLVLGVTGERRLEIMWIYGVSGLVGFLAQIVTGMQGRLVPLYAWYRAFDASGVPPAIGANSLPSPAFAGPIFGCWALGVPLLAWGLPTANLIVIRVAAVSLFAGVTIGLVYLFWMLRRARGR